MCVKKGKFSDYFLCREFVQLLEKKSGETERSRSCVSGQSLFSAFSFRLVSACFMRLPFLSQTQAYVTMFSFIFVSHSVFLQWFPVVLRVLFSSYSLREIVQLDTEILLLACFFCPFPLFSVFSCEGQQKRAAAPLFYLLIEPS